MKYVVGIDGGGTKTEAILADASGNILGVGYSGPSNYLTVGKERFKENIVSAIHDAKRSAKVKFDKANAIGLGVAGTCRLLYKNEIENALKGLAKKIIVQTDVYIAFVGALPEQYGVIVISGTGSIACGSNGNRIVYSSGWGHILGDEGSGYDIARSGLRAALSYYDGRASKTILLEKFKERLGIKKVEEIVIKVRNMTVEEISMLADVVKEAYQQKDKTATSILESAGISLAQSACAVISKLNMQNEKIPVTFIGGVLNNIPFVKQVCMEHILARARNAYEVPPRYPPAIGALLLAFKEENINLTDKIFSNIGKFLRRFAARE